MAKSIQAVLRPQLLLEPVETAICRAGLPRTSLCVSKERAFRMFEHQTSSYLNSCFSQVDDSGSSFSFGFFLRKQPSTILQIDMSCLNSKQLLGSRATLPGNLKQFTKFVVGNRLDYFLVFTLGYALIPSATLWLLKVGNRIPLDVPHLLRPTKRPLNGNDATAFVPIRPIGIGINPLLDVVRLKLIDVELRRRFQKPLATFAIPIVGSRRPMLQCPIKKSVEDSSNGLSADCPFCGTSHQLVKTLKSTLAIAAEVMPLAINRDEPRFAISSIPRFR